MSIRAYRKPAITRHILSDNFVLIREPAIPHSKLIGKSPKLVL